MSRGFVTKLAIEPAIAEREKLSTTEGLEGLEQIIVLSFS